VIERAQHLTGREVAMAVARCWKQVKTEQPHDQQRQQGDQATGFMHGMFFAVFLMRNHHIFSNTAIYEEFIVF